MTSVELDPDQRLTLETQDTATECGDDDGRRSAAGSFVPLMLLFGACAALVAGRPISDNSALTHIATGRLIVDGGVPGTNPFLYSSTDFPIPSWGWSILLGLADVLGGAVGIRLLVAAVGAALGVVVVALTGPWTERTRLLEVVVPSSLTMMCMVEFLNARPHLVAFVLLGVAVLVLNRHWSPWWMVPVFAVWVNVHGSWSYGLGVVGLLVVARLVDERRFEVATVLPLGSALLGTLLGAAAYPDRFALMVLPLRQFGDPIEREALQSYTEWGRPNLATLMLWPMLVLGLLALVGCWRQRRFGSLGAVVLLIALGVSGIRMIPLAAIALVPFAASGLRGLGSLGAPSGRSAKVLNVLAATIAVLAVVAVGGAFDHESVVDGYALDSPKYPADALDWLEARGLAGDDTRLQTDMVAGNYASWRFGADANVFVDDRPGATTLIEYRRMLRLEDGWQDALARSNPDVIVWETELPLTEELSSDDAWVSAGEFDEHTVFCRAAWADRCL